MNADEQEEWLDGDAQIAGRPLYFHKDGTPARTRREGLDIFRDLWVEGSRDYARIGDTELLDLRVSTVFLVIDHAMSGPPVLFETMIFGDPYDQECWRWCTEEDAQFGHDRIVAWLRSHASLIAWRRRLRLGPRQIGVE